MKIKFKLTILMVSMMVVIVAGVSLLMLNRASGMSTEEGHKYLETMADVQVASWEGAIARELQTLRAVAEVMSGYRKILPYNRRNVFDTVLEGVLTNTPTLI